VAYGLQVTTRFLDEIALRRRGTLFDETGFQGSSQAEGSPSNLRVGLFDFDNAQHRQDRFIATNLANALEKLMASGVMARDINV